MPNRFTHDSSQRYITGAIQGHLEALFHAVFQAVSNGNAAEWGETGYNAKGDKVKWFDLAADRAVCRYLEEQFPYPVRLLSEEGSPREFGPGAPEFTVVLDPVDGSVNFAQGLRPAGMAVALIPAHLRVATDTVQFALVGDLFGGQSWFAARGEGAFCQGRPISASSVTELAEALLNCDLDHELVAGSQAGVLAAARGVRAFGAATQSLVMVASGALDAHLDLRGLLTAENFLAPALLIAEAGGLLTDPAGQPLPEVHSLTEAYSIIASATPELHQLLINALSTKV